MTRVTCEHCLQLRGLRARAQPIVQNRNTNARKQANCQNNNQQKNDHAASHTSFMLAKKDEPETLTWKLSPIEQFFGTIRVLVVTFRSIRLAGPLIRYIR